MNGFEKSFQVAGVAPRRSIVHRPGLRTMPLGTERYKVAGSGLLVLEIKSGDRITVMDLEGGQFCEIVAIGTDGRSDPALLGATEAREPSGLKAILASDEE